jgi:oligoendopeptidase F
VSVTAESLPTPADLADATWEGVSRRYQALLDQPLDEANVEGWLAAWSALDAALMEAAGLAMIAYTCDTADAAKEAAHLRFASDILPRVDELGVKLADRLLALGYAPPALDQMVRRFRTHTEVFREANVPLSMEVEQLDTRYQKVTGGLTVTWDGVEKTIPELQRYLQSPDRATRERAFRASSAAYLAHKDELSGIFDRMLDLRQQIARNAGLGDYEAYAFKSKCRFDYTPADCARFHESVERHVTPAVERLHGRRRERMRLDSVRPWDLGADPHGRAGLAPFGEVTELISRTRTMFRELSPALGQEYDTMVREGLLDLGTRKGKAPGGYCETLPYRGRPFIFMNAAGVADDVSTLLHEAGHAFHAFSAHAQALVWQRQPGLEACELASMSMELLAAPFLDRDHGGFYDREDLARARTEHLEDILITLQHVAGVDAFQSWLYTSGEGGDPVARDRAWLRLRSRFERGVDWEGLERERTIRWYRQPHIFLSPFYYIEYGIAQLGALQVWRNSLHDRADAVARYRAALALGATRPLPEIFATAGARFSFEPELMGELVALVEEELSRWEESSAAA